MGLINEVCAYSLIPIQSHQKVVRVRKSDVLEYDQIEVAHDEEDQDEYVYYLEECYKAKFINEEWF